MLQVQVQTQERLMSMVEILLDLEVNLFLVQGGPRMLSR